MNYLSSLFKKISDPLMHQLKQGVTPHELALSIAFGFVLGILPILGVTTSLCAIVAVIFKLNQVAIQTVNYLAYPVQITLFVPFIYLGEKIYQRPPTALDINSILEQFKSSFIIACQKYFILGLMGATAWLIIAPIIFIIIYLFSKFILKKFINKKDFSREH